MRRILGRLPSGLLTKVRESSVCRSATSYGSKPRSPTLADLRLSRFSVPENYESLPLTEKFAGRPGRDYTVVGNGGLVRLVRIPDDLADRLKAARRDEPVRVTDRGIHYTSRYDVAAGTAWGASFTGASKRALG